MHDAHDANASRHQSAESEIRLRPKLKMTTAYLVVIKESKIIKKTTSMSIRCRNYN
jgi:hypothetical protein